MLKCQQSNGLAVSQNFPVNGFKWRNDTLNFYEDFKQNYDENSDREYILEIDVDYPEQL